MLKKHSRSQEDKMKRMATKLLKLTADDRGDMKRGVQHISGKIIAIGVCGARSLQVNGLAVIHQCNPIYVNTIATR